MRAVLVACLALAGCTASNAFYNCGGLGAKCCPDTTCKSGGSCNGGTCVQCGAPGQACCGGQCGAGSACANGLCASCGGAGQPCCSGNACGNGGCCVNQTCTA